MRLHISITYILAALCSIACARPPTKRQVAYDWNSSTSKLRGVNIGGWLVLEPFITPSIFTNHSSDDWAVGSEWSLCQKLGPSECYKVLKAHWDTFVQLEDFERIKKAGFNAVRIPVGYWSYLRVEEEYVAGAAPYLDKAIKWARQTGLKVIIDLHGAPKSQNGFDHSGRATGWPQWGEGDSIQKTHEVLKKLAKRYTTRAMREVVIGLELLNEPFVHNLDAEMVKQFYRDAYYNIRLVSEDMPVVMHDGFERPSWLNTFLTPADNNASNVVVDHHEYQIFDAYHVSIDPFHHRIAVCEMADYWAASDKWMIVGEWSAAMTDCAPHINGFKTGSRHEGAYADSWWMGPCAGKTGRVKDWSDAWRDDVRRYIETQLDAFHYGAGLPNLRSIFLI